MPAKSKSQQLLFGMIHAYQKGKLKNASPEIRKIAKGIDKDSATHFAETKHKGLPERVGKKKRRKIHSFESFITEKLNSEKKIEDMSSDELKAEDKHYIKLQNSYKLTPHEERRWKQISKKINDQK